MIKWDVSTGQNLVLIDEITFANGVQLSPDEDFVLVCETWASRVLRFVFCYMVELHNPTCFHKNQKSHNLVQSSATSVDIGFVVLKLELVISSWRGCLDFPIIFAANLVVSVETIFRFGIIKTLDIYS